MSAPSANGNAPLVFGQRTDSHARNNSDHDVNPQSRQSGSFYNILITSVGGVPEFSQPDSSLSSRGGEEEVDFWAAEDVEQQAIHPGEQQQQQPDIGAIPRASQPRPNRSTLSGDWAPASAADAAVGRSVTRTPMNDIEDRNGGNEVEAGARDRAVAHGPSTGVLELSPEQLRRLGSSIALGDMAHNNSFDYNERVARTLSGTTGGSSVPMFPNRQRRRLFGGVRARRDWLAGGSTVAGGDGAGMSGAHGGAETGDNSDMERHEGRILFYHKPTLANVPAGDIPDAVPVYLGCPGGGMALGLPLDEAWQGRGQQDTTFNPNLSYTILSWPERHVKDLMEIRQQQVLFAIVMAFNLLVAALLFFVENPDRARVEPPARVGSFPGPFEQRVGEDAETIARAQEQHLVAAFAIGLWGVFGVVSLSRAAIALYLCLTVVSVIIGLGASPDALYACRYMVEIVLVVIGRSLLSTITYAWVTAAAGDGR